MQMLKTPENVVTPQGEEGERDAERHRRAAISDDLLRIVQLVSRHRLAFTQFTNDHSRASNFFAYRKSGLPLQPPHIDEGDRQQDQSHTEGNQRQKTPRNRT